MKLLFYLHNFELNGSNMTAFNYLTHLCTKLDCVGQVSSQTDGPMRKLFESIGVEPIIESEIQLKFARNADTIFINSLIRHDAMYSLHQNGIKFFQFVHEDWAPCDFRGLKNPEWGWYLPSWTDVGKWLSSCRCLIFPATYLSKNFDTLKHEVIYNPVNMSSLANVKLIENNYAEDEIHIINIGSINNRKNQKLIVNMAASSAKIIRTDFYGQRHIRLNEQKYFEELTQLIDRKAKTPIHIHKAQFPLSIVASSSTVFVLVSSSEVLPCTIQEMMMAGIPVVAPNKWGIPEIIQSGINGVLFETYNINEILEAAIYAKLNSKSIVSEAKRTVATQFDLGKQSQKLLNLIGN